MKKKGNFPEQSFSISTFEFILTPLSITHSLEDVPAEAQFFLELHKGPQIMTRMGQSITFPQRNEYTFSGDERLHLKLFDQAGPQYSVSLYHQLGCKEYLIHPFPLDILTFYKKYTEQLDRYQKDVRWMLERMEKNQVLGKSWKSLKSNLKNHQQVFSTSDQKGQFTVAFALEIRTNIDSYDEAHPQLIRILTKSSWESRKTISSGSVKGQKKKQQHNTASSEGKNQHLLQQESKLSHLSFQQSKIQHLQQEESKVDLLQEEQKAEKELTPKPSTVLSTDNQSPSKKGEGSTLVLPSLVNKNELLSDIIERSNEGESNVNATDRRWKQLPEIEEEKDHLLKSKTEKHLPKFQYDFGKSRSLEEDRLSIGAKSEAHSQIKVKFVDLQEEDYLAAFQSDKGEQLQRARGRNPVRRPYLVILMMLLVWVLVSMLGIFQIDFGSKRLAPKYRKLKKWKVK